MSPALKHQIGGPEGFYLRSVTTGKQIQQLNFKEIYLFIRRLESIFMIHFLDLIIPAQALFLM